MNVLFGLLIFLWASHLNGQTSYLNPGECVVIHGRRICADAVVERPEVIKEALTQRKNIFCVCEYGIKPVVNAGDPMKGYWLRQVRVDVEGQSESMLKNYGSDEHACNAALVEHPACRVGVTTFNRTRVK